MATISAFRALHYNPATFADASNVLTPPYDVISESEATAFLKRSPYNFAHLDLPRRDGDDYLAQKKEFDLWRKEQVLVRDSEPHYYFYRQQYRWDGHDYTRDAIVAAVQVRDFADRVVLPHEHTHGKAKSDRLALVNTFGAQLSHVFGVVKDESSFLAETLGEVPFSKTLLRGKSDDGTTHAVWQIPTSLNATLEDFFKERPIYIVDGHHRYEVSVQYAKAQGAYRDASKSQSSTVFSICTTTDPGLIVLPTHRIVKGVGDWETKWARVSSEFNTTPMAPSELKAFTSKPADVPCFAVAWRTPAGVRAFLVSPKMWQSRKSEFGYALHKLSVHWSDRVFLKNVADIPDTRFAEHLVYERDFERSEKAIEQASFVVFQPQPRVSDMTDVADESKFMPPKSTYFYPKLASGLLIREL